MPLMMSIDETGPLFYELLIDNMHLPNTCSIKILVQDIYNLLVFLLGRAESCLVENQGGDTSLSFCVYLS